MEWFEKEYPQPQSENEEEIFNDGLLRADEKNKYQKEKEMNADEITKDFLNKKSLNGNVVMYILILLSIIILWIVIGLSNSNQHAENMKIIANQDTIKQQVRLHNNLHKDNIGNVYVPRESKK
jgi:hypothetical protein